MRATGPAAIGASTPRRDPPSPTFDDPASLLVDPPDVRAALSTGSRWLAAGHPGRSLVAIVDPAGKPLRRLPAGTDHAWAIGLLRGRADGCWTTSAPVADGVRVVVALDRPDPPAELTSRAAIVALGVARASLVERDRARADELRRLVSTAKNIAVSLELDPLLREIVQDAAGLIGADSGDMLLLDDDGTRLSVVALTNFPADMLGLEFAFGEGLSTQAMLARRPLIVSDYVHYEHRIASIDRYDLRSVLCAPLVVRDRAIGALNVHGIHAPREFSQHDAELLAAFADLAAIAIDHARRYENELRLGRELAAANDEITRVLTLQRRLTELVVRDAGIEAIVVELAERLDRPLVLHDHLSRLIAGAAPGGSDAWQALVARRERRPARRSREAELLSALVAAPETADEAVTAPVRVGRDTVAHLTVAAGERAGPLDQALLDTASTGLALEFAKVLARVEVEHRLRGDAVMDLITGSYSSEEAMVARAAHLGYDVAAPHDVLVVDIDDFHVLTERHGEQAVVQIKQRFFDVVHAEVVGRVPGSLVSAQSDSIIVLLATSAGSRLTPETLAMNLQQVVAAALPGVTISVGVGDRTERPDDYGRSFRIARESLDLMHRLGRRGVVIGAQQLGASRLLLKTSSPEELRAYVLRTLGPLLDPERRGSADLHETLRAYLESGQSQRAAARACSVHVNTVVYRLQRVSELLGVDLVDPSVVFDLTLAFRILDVVGPSTRRE